MGIDFDKEYPKHTRYLSSADLEGQAHVVVVEKVVREEMRQSGGEGKVIRPVLYLKDHAKGLVLTQDTEDDPNAQEQTAACAQIVGLLGKDSDGWPGKAIELYPSKPMKVFGKMRTPIRVREAPAGTAPAKPAAPTTAPTPPPAKEVLNPAQIDFKALLKRTFTAEQMKDGTAAEKVGEAIVTALGKDYEGDDWRTLSATQLESVAEALKVTNPTAEPLFDPNDIPF